MTLSRHEQKYFFLNMKMRETVEEEELKEKPTLKKEAAKKCFKKDESRRSGWSRACIVVL